LFKVKSKGLLPKSLFLGSETLFDKSKALVPGNLKNALWAQITSHAGLRRKLCAENVSMGLKRILFGQQP